MTYLSVLTLLAVGQASSVTQLHKALLDSPTSASTERARASGKRKAVTTSCLDWLTCAKRRQGEKKLTVFFVRHGRVVNPEGRFYGRHEWAPEEFGLCPSEGSMEEKDIAAETIHNVLMQKKAKSGKVPPIVGVVHSPLKRTRESANALVANLEQKGWAVPRKTIDASVIEVNVPSWEMKKVKPDRFPLQASVPGRRGFDWRCIPEEERCRVGEFNQVGDIPTTWTWTSEYAHPPGAPGGEMFTDVYHRAAGVCEKLWEDYAGSDAQGERVVIVVTHADVIMATKLFAHGRDARPAQLTEDYLCNWRDAYCRGYRNGESERLQTNRDYHVNGHFHVSALEYTDSPTGRPHVTCTDEYLPHGRHPACWQEAIPTTGELDNRGAAGQLPYYLPRQ